MPLRASSLLTSAVTVVALGLVGCGAEPQQPSTSLPEPATSSAAEPTPELPPLGPPDLPMPDEARVQDEAGAEAFLRYYMEVYNHAQRTMNSTHLRELSRTCALCDRLADGLDADAAAGYSHEGGEVTVAEVSTPFLRSEDEAEIAFAVAQGPLTVTKDGAPVEGLTFPGSSSTTDGAILEWDEERATWLLAQWDAA